MFQKNSKKFREYFKPRIITHGKHHNPLNMLAAIKAYNQNRPSWNNEQAMIFLINIIGYLFRMFPACYAQAVCQGFHEVTNPDRPLLRRLTTSDNMFYYPADPLSEYGLGFDSTIHTILIGWDGLILSFEEHSKIPYSVCNSGSTFLPCRGESSFWPREGVAPVKGPVVCPDRITFEAEMINFVTDKLTKSREFITQVPKTKVNSRCVIL